MAPMRSLPTCEVRGSAGGVADLRMLMRNQPRLMCNFENMLRTSFFELRGVFSVGLALRTDWPMLPSYGEAAFTHAL
jgi:hypothetical protein